MGIVILSDKLPFVEGGERVIYVHPFHPDKCLKIAKPTWIENGMRKQLNNVFYRFIPLENDNPNIRDYQSLIWLESCNDKSAWNHIPKCYGFVKTDLGNVLCMQLMRNADGSIAPKLADRILHG